MKGFDVAQSIVAECWRSVGAECWRSVLLQGFGEEFGAVFCCRVLEKSFRIAGFWRRVLELRFG